MKEAVEIKYSQTSRFKWAQTSTIMFNYTDYSQMNKNCGKSNNTELLQNEQLCII